MVHVLFPEGKCCYLSPLPFTQCIPTRPSTLRGLTTKTSLAPTAFFLTCRADHKGVPRSEMWVAWWPGMMVEMVGMVGYAFTHSRLCWNFLPSFKLFSRAMWLLQGCWERSRLVQTAVEATTKSDRLWRLLGKVTPSRLLLNSSPKVNSWRLAGRVTCWRLWLYI